VLQNKDKQNSIIVYSECMISHTKQIEVSVEDG